MAKRELAGMILMAFAGVGAAMTVILVSVVKQFGFPYFPLLGTACICLGFVFTVVLMIRDELSTVAPNQWKWVVMRGFFGSSTFILTVLATVVGAPMGDASALQSINVVAAALLGRAFLGESLRPLHVCALTFSVIGAGLVSKPEALFGAPAGESTAWLGYVLALAAGTTSGGSFIACRKLPGVNPLLMSASGCFQEGLTVWILFGAGLTKDSPLSTFSSAPFSAAAALAVVILVAGGASCALSAGAQLCPAAIASTVFSSTNMSLCFCAQVFLHGEVPTMMSLVGATLLLLGVALMALARSVYSASPKEDQMDVSDQGSEARSIGSTPSDTTSLASFIASEFSGLSPSSCRSTRTGGSVFRQRRVTAVTSKEPAHLAADVLGAASAEVFGGA